MNLFTTQPVETSYVADIITGFSDLKSQISKDWKTIHAEDAEARTKTFARARLGGAGILIAGATIGSIITLCTLPLAVTTAITFFALSVLAFMVGRDIRTLSSNMERQNQSIENQDLSFWAFVIRGGIANMFSTTRETKEDVVNKFVANITDKTYFKPLWNDWFKSIINEHIEAQRNPQPQGNGNRLGNGQQ